MKKANWIIKDNNIFSLDFDDFYYNTKDPIKERLGVYVNNAFDDNLNKITILELGFGIGLNFLLSVELAKEKGKKIHYVSIENHYHNLNDLEKFVDKFGLKFDDNFKSDYPPCKDGIYRICGDFYTLDLVFCDVLKALDDLDFKADFVFADGFSPKKNDEMFCKETLEKLSYLLKPNAKLLSYSSNSSFRANLTNLGFEIENINLGIKRESTKAIYKATTPSKIDGYFHKNYLNAENIAIIGGGVAGATLAYELSKLGKNISVFEKDNSLANEGSGNKIGLLTALIQNPDSLLGEFSEFSYWHSSRLYKKLGLNLEGVIEHAHNDELKKRFAMQKQNPLFKIIGDYAFLKDGGSLEPYKVVPMIFELSKANIFLNEQLLSFNQISDSVKLNFANKSLEFDAVIFATGADSKEFFTNLPLSRMRGQVTWLKDELDYKHPISSKAYLTGAKNGMRVLGATYDRNLIAPINPSDDEKNIANFNEYFKDDLKHLIIGSRVGYRSYSSDRFAIVGAMHDENIFNELYKSLQFTKYKTQVNAPLSRVFIDTAHGSRGLASALTSARLIASYFNNIPSGMFKRYEHALHPARFLIRKLKKGL